MTCVQKNDVPKFAMYLDNYSTVIMFAGLLEGCGELYRGVKNT